VGDGVLGVDPDRNAGMVEECRHRIVSGAIAAVENNFHLYHASMGVHERFGDGCGGKAIGLDQGAFFAPFSASTTSWVQLGVVPYSGVKQAAISAVRTLRGQKTSRLKRWFGRVRRQPAQSAVRKAAKPRATAS
jgi:hypothetical protein